MRHKDSRFALWLSNHTAYLFAGLLVMVVISACMSDPFVYTSDSRYQPQFHQDTVRMDTLLSRRSSATYILTLYNPTEKNLLLEKIYTQKGNQSEYRINVDGRSGEVHQKIPLAAHDSLMIRIEATYPKEGSDLPTEVKDSLLVECLGKRQGVLLQGFRQNVEAIGAERISSDRTFSSQRPYWIRDSLIVEEGATLTLEAGAHLLLDAQAYIRVKGSLRSEGAPHKRVMIQGSRLDHLLPSVSYQWVPGQWQGIVFSATSHHNEISYTTIRNAHHGLYFAPSSDRQLQKLRLYGSVITNMTQVALHTDGGIFGIENSELSNTGSQTLDIASGEVSIKFCTIANLYPWDLRKMPALVVRDKENASVHLEVLCSVVDGSRTQTTGTPQIGGEELLIPTSLADRVRFEGCFLRSPITASPKVFVSCTRSEGSPRNRYRLTGWDSANNKSNFLFDFRPLQDSDLAKIRPSSATPATDLLGKSRASQATIGAYKSVEATTPAPWWVVEPHL